MASAAAARDGRPTPRGAPFTRRQTAKPHTRRVAPPLEHRILVTATLCLLAFGAVMVYSASSPSGVIAGSGLGAGEFVRYLIFSGLGLVGMQVMARGGLPATAAAIARIWSGVVPQQPPTIFTSPALANSPSSSAMNSGLSS